MATLAEQGNRPPAQAAPPTVPPQAARRGVTSRLGAAAEAVWRGVINWLFTLARRYPLISVFMLLVLSNAAGTAFNVFYNFNVIVMYMDERQFWAFRFVAIPLYNGVVWPVGIAIVLYLFWPLRHCLRRLRAGEPIEPEFMEFCRRRVIDLPYLEVWVAAWLWFPAGIVFPLIICVVGSSHNWDTIGWRFLVSFGIAALITIVQSFFFTESFLVKFLYPEFFRDARPEWVRDAHQVPYRPRLIVLWLAVACMPLLALFVALWNTENGALASWLFFSVAVTSLGIFGVVGMNLLTWVNGHAAAMDEIARQFQRPYRRAAAR